jgi:hypothetical protein
MDLYLFEVLLFIVQSVGSPVSLIMLVKAQYILLFHQEMLDVILLLWVPHQHLNVWLIVLSELDSLVMDLIEEQLSFQGHSQGLEWMLFIGFPVFSLSPVFVLVLFLEELLTGVDPKDLILNMRQSHHLWLLVFTVFFGNLAHQHLVLL